MSSRVESEESRVKSQGNPWNQPSARAHQPERGLTALADHLDLNSLGLCRRTLEDGEGSEWSVESQKPSRLTITRHPYVRKDKTLVRPATAQYRAKLILKIHQPDCQRTGAADRIVMGRNDLRADIIWPEASAVGQRRRITRPLGESSLPA